MGRITPGALLGLAGLMSVATVGQAATVSIDTPNFLLQYNDAQKGLLLWDAPTAAPGSITFNPVDFAAVATGPDFSVGTANATIKFTLTAKNNRVFTGFNWFESGDYTRLLAPDPETGVFVGGQMWVSDANSADFAKSNFSVSDLSATGVGLDWDAAAGLGAGAFSGPLSKVTVTIQNDLLAYVFDNQVQAKIEKKFGQLRLTTQVVPLPPAAFMFLGAIVALAGVARRRT